MCAMARFVEYNPTSSGMDIGYPNVYATNPSCYGRGIPAWVRGYTPSAIPINIDSSNNTLRLRIYNGSTSAAKDFILASGISLDPRMISRDITDKMHQQPPVNSPEWTCAYCFWNYNGFEIRSGCAGASGWIQIEDPPGGNSAADTLGFTSDKRNVQFSGQDDDRLYRDVDGTIYTGAKNKITNTYSGSTSSSGTSWAGGFDEYVIVAVDSTGGGGATIQSHDSGAYPGTITIGGIYNHSTSTTYKINVSISGSTSYMNGTLGNVPAMTWSGAGGDITSTSSNPIQLLWPNYPYKLGNQGLWIKFSNAPFSYPGDSWTIVASGIPYTSNDWQFGQLGRYVIWSSLRGDTQWTPQPTSSDYFQIGTKGLFIKPDYSYPVACGDTFRVRLPGPVPYQYDISSINLGNITVSTSSRIFCVSFQLIGGAVELTNVKFGLLSDGGMAWHYPDGSKTAFRWGTVGPGQSASSQGYNIEWRNGVNVSDLIPPKPGYLYAIDQNLLVVATADDSKTIGVSPMESLMSDYIFNAITLAAEESGAKTITYRCYFDYTE